MQTDGSAFEGWAICLKACFPDIKTVLLDWDEPQYGKNEKEVVRQQKHYNRFVLRAMMFERNYGWVSVAKSKIPVFDEFNKNYPNLVINYPKSESKEVCENGKVNKGEAILERRLVERMRSNVSITDHQLPVGLFSGKVLTENTCTPRGASQIDLWQLENDTLRIFELKDKNNNSVGIISELMFYANVMNMLIKGEIHYPSTIKKAKNIRHIKELYDAIVFNKIERLEAIFLNNEFHPLIEAYKGQILDIINLGMDSRNIMFRHELVTDYLK